ncbi:MAG: hypothetical protein ACREXR_13130, partial [Gammaproteobacteria bacterium]
VLGPIRRERIGNATGGPQGARQGWRATILMYFNIHSGCSSRPWNSPLRGLRSISLPAKRSCAPAERDFPSLATIFSQALREIVARRIDACLPAHAVTTLYDIVSKYYDKDRTATLVD